MTASRARDRLLAAADELFAHTGITATPVDEAVRRADVATMTLYRHFGGKDGLVSAYLRNRHERWMRDWEQRIAEAPDAPGRLLAVFDVLDAWWRAGSTVRGCAFVDAAAELPDRAHPAWREIEAHKRDVRRTILEQARGVDPDDAETLADQVLLVYEGVLGAILVGHVEQPIAQGRTLAAALLAARDGRQPR